MRKERKHYTAEEKVAILRRHFLDKVPVSEQYPRGPTPDFFLHPASRIRTPLYCLAASRLPRSVPAAEGVGMQTRFSVITGPSGFQKHLCRYQSQEPSRQKQDLTETVARCHTSAGLDKWFGSEERSSGGNHDPISPSYYAGQSSTGVFKPGLSSMTSSRRQRFVTRCALGASNSIFPN